MRAGRLSERLVIRTAGTPASDGQGGTTATPAILVTIWAESVPLSAAEQLQAESVGSHAIYRFNVRVRSDVTPAMTVEWTPRWPPDMAAKTLQILGVQPSHDRKSMHLSCAEVH